MPAAPLSHEEERAALRAMHAKRRCWSLFDGGAAEALHEARVGIFEARKKPVPVCPIGVTYEDYLAMRGRHAIVDAVRRLHGRPSQHLRKAPHLGLCELEAPRDLLAVSSQPTEDPVARVALERAVAATPAFLVEAVLLRFESGASQAEAQRVGVTESALSQRRMRARRLLARRLIDRSRAGIHPL